MRKKNDNALWMALAVMAWAVFLLTVAWLWLREEPAETQLPTLAVELSEAVSEPITEVAAEEPEADVVAVLPEPGWFREEIPLDREIQEALHEACLATGLREELALAVIRKETNYRNVMGDGGNSYGFMQVQPRWHGERMERLGVTDLMEPYQNFLTGCDYLMELTAKYDLPVALTVYNSGKTGVSDYAVTVMRYMDEISVKSGA